MGDASRRRSTACVAPQSHDGRKSLVMRVSNGSYFALNSATTRRRD